MIRSIQVEITYVSWKLSWLSLVITLRIPSHAANEKFSLSMTSERLQRRFISLKIFLALSKLDVWKLYWPPKYNSVCLYFLALNLILHSEGILQQDSLCRNSKFYFFCIQLFQAVWSSTIGGNDCITYLPGHSPSPSMRAASEPQESLGSACTGSQVCHPGLLVWQTDPDAVMGISQGSSWQCPAGQLLLMRIHLRTRIQLDHLCLCCLTRLHAHFPFMLVSRLFLQAFMRPKWLGKGDGQENAGWSVDCSLLVE